MSRTEKLWRRLRQEETQLLDTVIPELQIVARGRNTGLFVTRDGVPTAAGAPILNKAQEILRLAAQLGEPSSGLVADVIVRAFEHANDRANEHRLGPIRLAQELLKQLESRT